MTDSSSPTLALFDFDGTLTTKDSLGDFIHFAVGTRKTMLGALILSPVLVGYALGVTNNNAAKQHVISYFFKGMSIEKVQALGREYVEQKLAKILRLQGVEKLQWHQAQGHHVVIVSASAECWLKPWADMMGFDLIATKLESDQGFLTGRFAGENCHGEEKVNRINKAFNLTEFKTIYAYGDTSGDKPMLALANHTFYKPFR